MAELFLVDSPQPAAAASPDLPDARERELALDIRQSWIIEAPAGSGKTGLLIQRYLKLLADESVTSPEQVLAITFTKKATAEMRDRVLEQLESAAKDEPARNAFDSTTRPLAQAALDRDRSLNWSLLEQPGRLNIRTIDSICGEIANSLPVLSGNGGRRKPLEDASALYSLAARRTLMQLGEDNAELHGALRTFLLHRDGNLADVERLLASMLQFREQWGDLIPLGRRNLDDAWLDANVLPRLELALDRAICATLTRLGEAIPASILDQLTKIAADMAHIEGHGVEVSPLNICSGRHVSPGETVEHLEHWRALIHLLVKPSDKGWRVGFKQNHLGFRIPEFELEQLRSIIEALQTDDGILDCIREFAELPPAKYPREQWVVAKALFRILNRTLAELQLVFAEREECDFAELSLATRTALRHNDGPRDLEAAFGMRLQHLLVDEMQDTSSSQYELIQTLTQAWDGHSQTVFLVGDPKQSIYLFRQARVERFLRTVRSGELGDLPLGSLKLTANFRSQAELVNQFNSDFQQIFPAASSSQPLEEVPFVAASAIRSANKSAAGRVWHTNILPCPEDTAEGARAKRQRRLDDAREIREIVTRWRSRPLPPGRDEPWSIAVLVRSRSHLDEIVASFKGDAAHAPIPFRAVEIEVLKERPEVQDIYALTRALLHPADRIAWLSVLHAPWCGFGLAELHILTGADDPAFAQQTVMQLIQERGHLLDSGACLRLERAWPVLETAAAAIGRLPLAQTVERAWRSLGGDVYLGPEEAGNVRRYLELLDEAEAQPGSFSLAALERRLERLYADSAVHPEAVDLLTIHKAKGLEWDVVIVPALERLAGNNRGRLLTWLELDRPDEQFPPVLLAPIAGKGQPSEALNKWLNRIYNAREAAERKRLLYVACTRAREELHLFASPTLTSKGEIERKAGSLLTSAWPAAEPHFTAALAASHSVLPVVPVVEEPPDFGVTLPLFDGNPAFDIAASAAEAGERNSILKRLPLRYDPAARLRGATPLPYGSRDQAPSASAFERPEGSVAARAFGNSVHAFLEVIAEQIASGGSASSIAAALPAWTPRIAAILRSEGLPPAMVERLAQRVLHALEATLKDPHGLWLLSPHEAAATEYALTAWLAQRRDIRIDRTFRAGPEPLAGGSDYLWIVDYKTTTHGPEGLDVFLAEERTKYAPQLEAYAAVLAKTGGKPAIRLALYYPMLSKLIWWHASNMPSS
jgi:ATP-dependent exoDNAse (exonuclease V) beta subunit